MKFVATRLGYKALLLLTLLSFLGCGGGAPQSANSSPQAPPPTAPTATLSASPTTIAQGASSTLTWTTTNATAVSIDALGSVPADGSQIVSPTITTTYTLTASGAGGTKTATATVTVTVPAPPPPPPPPPPSSTYKFILLPLLPGATGATATAISSTGLIVGSTTVVDPVTGVVSNRATLWDGDGMATDIGEGFATGIGSEEEVSGFTSDNQAWFWSVSTGTIMIGVLPGMGFDSSLGQAIDDDGTVVGIAYLNQSASEEGFTWRLDTGLQPVQNLKEIFAIKNKVMAGTGINGQAATVTNTEFVSQETVTDLGVLGGTFSVAFGINGQGHACGDGDKNNGVTDAFFWSPSSDIVDLGTDGTSNSMGNAVNNLDQVVGFIGIPTSGMLRQRPRVGGSNKPLPHFTGNVDKAMIWTNSTGIVDLNTLTTSPDWTLTSANGINDKGEIVGSAVDTNLNNGAYLLEPQ